MALSIRFESTWRSRSRSPRMCGSGPSRSAHVHLVLADLGGRDRVVDERGEVDVRERVAERPGLDPRRVEDVADGLREPGRLVPDQREERLALLRRAPATAPAASAPRRSRPPSGCGARARRARRSPPGAPRGGAAPPPCAARPRRRGCSAPRSRRAGRGATRARSPRPRTRRAARARPEHPDRARADRQRSDERLRRPSARAGAPPDTAGRRGRARYDRVPVEHLLEHGAFERAAVPGGNSSSAPRPAVAIVAAPSSSASTIASRSNGTNAPQLADERAERLLELERGRERAGAAVRRLEHVDPTAELVAQRLRLAGARRPQPASCPGGDEPADDGPPRIEDPGRERHAVGA